MNKIVPAPLKIASMTGFSDHTNWRFDTIGLVRTARIQHFCGVFPGQRTFTHANPSTIILQKWTSLGGDKNFLNPWSFRNQAQLIIQKRHIAPVVLLMMNPEIHLDLRLLRRKVR